MVGPVGLEPTTKDYESPALTNCAIGPKSVHIIANVGGEATLGALSYGEVGIFGTNWRRWGLVVNASWRIALKALMALSRCCWCCRCRRIGSDPGQSQVQASITQLDGETPQIHHHQVNNLQGDIAADGTLRPLRLSQTDLLNRFGELPPWWACWRTPRW